MSKQNNLTDFLTDVANAIRAKKGSTDLINPQNFSAEITALSGGLEVIEMTETTATIEPNKVYVWGMVESLDITLGASTDDSDFFAFRFRCSKPTMTSLTVNGATWADDTVLNAEGKPILDLGSWYQCEIKGGTSVLYARLAHYIPFADSNVEAVLLAKGVGDGLGVTYKDAAKVTSISTWFKDNGVITSFDELKYFKNITTLGASTFQNCLNLEKVNLDNIVKLTGGNATGAFYNSGIKEVSLPKLSVIDNSYSCEFQNSLVERILSLGKITAIPNGSQNFGFCRNCTLLTYVNLPDTLTSIGNYAFYGCTSLAEITLPASLTSIGSAAFYDCSSLTEITFPASLTSIGDSAFRGCSKIAIASGLGDTQLTSIGTSAFSDCSSLAEIAFPASLTSIGTSAFSGCSSLAEIAFPASLTSIGTSAFSGTNISGEHTFESLTSIGARAFESTKVSKMRFPSLVNSAAVSNYEGIFSYCPNLILVDIGETCTTIGSNSFGRFVGTAGNDITFIIRATTPPALANKLISTQWVRAKIGVIFVPDESLEAYKTATNWSYYADILKPLSEYTEA